MTDILNSPSRLVRLFRIQYGQIERTGLYVKNQLVLAEFLQSGSVCVCVCVCVYIYIWVEFRLFSAHFPPIFGRWYPIRHFSA